MAGRTGQFEKIVGLPSQESFGFGGKLQHVENRTELETKAVNTKPYVEDKEEEVKVVRKVVISPSVDLNIFNSKNNHDRHFLRSEFCGYTNNNNNNNNNDEAFQLLKDSTNIIQNIIKILNN